MREDAVQMIKDRVTMQSLCEHLNIQINRSGFINCPFHAGDKNGSLKVYKETQRGWHCFGCNEGGDVIAFARKWYGTNFPDTINRLAEEFSIPIPTRKLSEAEKAEADKKRQEKERRRWLAQMEKASIEAEYWSALDAYNSNEKTLESYSPEMIGMMPDEFVRALIKKDELRFNLDLAEDKRRRLYAGKSHHESTKNAYRTTSLYGR